MRSRRLFHCLFAAALLPACGAPVEGENVDEVLLALDVCGEAVPANRAVDGIPAYAQCDATTNSSIWSNNGVDTSTTSLGPDWVQTQRSAGYQCTELAYRYMRFRWNVSYRSGDAQEWCDGDLPANLVKATTPVHGDLIVFAGGVCGAAESTGHIAVIDTADSARASVTIVEENRAGRRSTQQSCATCFLHAVANDGSPGGTAGGGGMTGMGGAAPQAGSGGVAGSPNGGGGSGGGPVPPGGTSGASTGTSGASTGASGAGTGTSGAGGSFATGGNGGSGAPVGGMPAAGMSGNAGSGSSAAGASGVTTEPVVADDALEGGCSVSRAHRNDRARDHSFWLGLALGLVGWRRLRGRQRLIRRPGGASIR